ncbi:unnamed protein product [Allacma fusca]|uniref:Glycylpeptide N-tetradecanoyltransferase n=1 Tax=Allacma fusca TaxID=39272 RepID=A0A8J2LTG4_9HEXA|nr:unnamed protein product [Allacma fusca]
MEPNPGQPNNMDQKSMEDLRKAMQAISMQQRPPRTTEEASHRTFQFWSTQPVPKLDEQVTTNEAIEPNQTPDKIRQDPYTLPDGFVWDTLDLDDNAVLKELYTLLSENYVEDDDCLFRFDYPANFLKWALKPPGWKLEWHCGVRVSKNKKLVGFISAIPATIEVHGVPVRIVEINFLCVHKKLRSKRVAPVLIREITRRVNINGIFQAVYTAGVVLPKPIATCRYWHRSLNPKKLIETRFSHLTRNMTLQRTIKLYRLPAEPKCKELRAMVLADVPAAHELLTKHLKSFKLSPSFDQEEFTHWFLPRPNIIDSYVVDKDGAITDMVSFYTLPSTVVNNPVHKSIKAAYAFYNVATSLSLQDLMQDALIIAKNSGFDVFNALDLMENKTFLETLKFGVGDVLLVQLEVPSNQAQRISSVTSLIQCQDDAVNLPKPCNHLFTSMDRV